MDLTKDKTYIFDLKLAKCLGLYQMLDGNATTIFGRNAYHAVIAVLALFVSVTCAWNVLGFYRLTNDPIALTFYVGCITNLLYSCYKIMNVLYYSRDIFEFVEVTGFDFMSYARYDATVFENWRVRSVRALYAYNAMSVVCVGLWILSPFVLTNAVVTIRRTDGSHTVNRMNVYNMFLMVSEDTYNDHFDAFLSMEIVICSCFLYFTVIFDNVIIIVCIALSSQLETIDNGFGSLGHDKTACNARNNYYPDNSNPIRLNEKYYIEVYDDLKTIITDHQNVIKKLNTFYNIFRPVLLIQIFVTSTSHICIWFIAALSFSEGKDGDSVLSVKLLMTLPMFNFQLCMMCILFSIINEKKDAINFSLYSSNWTDMNMKSKKLILYTMILNNSDVQQKLKITYTKIVNLELFTNTMRICYSVFSMLINYNKKKIN